MVADIEFGELQQEGPQQRVRPDRDRQFAVVACGMRAPRDLPIYVDLDVMRHMEAHARTDTTVELGGVLLGGKYLDEEGQPFVVVNEALRAEHYEATRGSFKFTHDTWARITRDRQDFEPLVPVGWYHTHPDWGVFLSGMDMFICDNFFGDALDVALVIDPYRGDRGWFCWNGQGKEREKRRVAGFSLFASRYRRSEVLQFARELAEPNPAYYDPRYEQPQGDSGMQPVVHLHQPRSGAGTAVLAGMLTIQTVILALLAWRLLVPAGGGPDPSTAGREHVWREILGAMTEGTPAGESIVQRVEELGQRNAELQTSVAGQALLVRELQAERDRVARQAATLERNLAAARDAARKKDDELAALRASSAGAPAGNLPQWLGWPVIALGGVVIAVAGVLGGWVLGTRRVLSDGFPRRRAADDQNSPNNFID